MTRKKAVLITGASRGIGAEIARKCTDPTVRDETKPLVLITARSVDRLHEMEKESNGAMIAIPADITRADDRAQLVDRIGKILYEQDADFHGLVHNAGVLRAKSFLKLTEEDWNVHYQTHLLGPAMLTQLLIPTFSSAGGHILHISSMGGFQGSKKFPGLSAYSAIKGALSILAECLSGELMDRNIACNALCLGAVQTEMLKEAFPGLEVSTQPEDMGAWISEFLWKGHRFFNGKILPVSLQDPG